MSDNIASKIPGFPSKFIDFKAPKYQIINESFYANARSVVVLSDVCKKALLENIPTASVYNIGCSLWSDKTFELIGQCIDYILDGEEMHKLSDYSKKEADDFLNSLSTQNFKEIQTFFDTMPKLKHEITAKCKVCGKENKRVLEGMGDFFA